ncbi:uncharacterized protein LOC134818366 isoform X2 [Bolinopsis microptera]|uniref:uncharacterized protein LOC134818366 isoform X2 n=1 Tax=Bolinopsis microptera TaxID=2820187 RepID=UPI00307AEF5B
MFLTPASRPVWQMSPSCHFEFDPLKVDLFELETEIKCQKHVVFGPWGDTTHFSRCWTKTPKRGKKNSRRGKRRQSTRKIHPKRRMTVTLDTRSVASFPSSYLQDYKRQKQELARRLNKKKDTDTVTTTGTDKKPSLSLTDVKLCDYQDLAKLGKNLPSLSQTILKYDAADHTSMEQNHIPHGLQPRTQLKQPKKCRKVSVPYVDHLTQHLTELRAQSICTIIEPRDPKTFRISNTSSAMSEQSTTTSNKLDLPVREPPPLLPTKVKTAVDTIRSYTIDQQKEKLSDYLSGVEVRRQNSKASFVYPKREKSYGYSSPGTKKLGETTGATITPSKHDQRRSAVSPSNHRLDHECMPSSEDQGVSRGSKGDYRHSRQSTIMWQQPMSYDIGSSNKIHLPDIQAVVKITEKAMKEAFMTPFPGDQPDPVREKAPLPATPPCTSTITNDL